METEPFTDPLEVTTNTPGGLAAPRCIKHRNVVISKRCLAGSRRSKSGCNSSKRTLQNPETRPYKAPDQNFQVRIGQRRDSSPALTSPAPRWRAGPCAHTHPPTGPTGLCVPSREECVPRCMGRGPPSGLSSTGNSDKEPYEEELGSFCYSYEGP